MSVDGMHCEWKVLIEEEYIWFDVWNWLHHQSWSVFVAKRSFLSW
jgi:hypothetical protein